MFTTSVPGGKAFAAKKIRELKTRVAKPSIQKLKISPTKITLNSAVNMNNIVGEKYGISPEEIEKRPLSNENFKTLFNFHMIEKTRQVHGRLNSYDKKKYKFKTKKLRENLNTCGKVLVLAERITNKSAAGKNFRSSQCKILRILTETKYFQSEKNRKFIKLIIIGSKMFKTIKF